MREIRILQRPDFPPYVCYNCKCDDSVREFFIDLGVDMEYDGALFYCNSCMLDLGIKSGLFVTNQEHLTILHEQSEFAQDYFKLLDKLTLWKQAFNELTGNSLDEFFENLEKVKNGIGRSDQRNSETISGESGVPETTELPIEHTELQSLNVSSEPERDDSEPIKIQIFS